MREDESVFGCAALFRDVESQGALLADALASAYDAYVRQARALIERAREMAAEPDDAPQASPLFA